MRHANMHRHVVRLDCVKETKMKSSFNIIIVIIAWLFKACLVNGVTVMLNWLVIMCYGVKALCGINACCHEDCFTNAYDYFNSRPKNFVFYSFYMDERNDVPCISHLNLIKGKAINLSNAVWVSSNSSCTHLGNWGEQTNTFLKGHFTQNMYCMTSFFLLWNTKFFCSCQGNHSHFLSV